MAAPGVCLEDRFCFVLVFLPKVKKKRETKASTISESRVFFKLSSISIWGWTFAVKGRTLGKVFSRTAGRCPLDIKSTPGPEL